MKSAPKLYKAGARQLFDKIKEHRDVMNWNEKGELMYQDKPITGSHVVDLVTICFATEKDLSQLVGRCLRGDWPE